MTTRPAILALHAFPLGAEMWESQRAALVADGYRVVAPDLPPAGAFAATFDAWADRVLELVAGPFVPAGVSMGGYLSFALWRKAPERIRGLVLADTRAGAESDQGKAGRAEMIRRIRREGVAAVVGSLADRALAPDASPEARDRFRAIAASRSADELVGAIEAIRDRADSTALLSRIDRPVLVVVGEEDVLTPPAEAEAIASRLPDARLVRIPNCGHLPSLEQPEVLTRAMLRFLAELR